MRRILVTGCAGFIGATLILKMLSENQNRVLGLDNLSDYYDSNLKRYRLAKLSEAGSSNSNPFEYHYCDITDHHAVEAVFRNYRPDTVIHLAAQAGVRYSINHPDTYIQTNIVGSYHILEACRMLAEENPKNPPHLMFASSSSVYGNSGKESLTTQDRTDTPVSLYAATKKCDEILAYAYSKLFHIPVTGLRFFTVYGPMGRPDMAYYSFTEKWLSGANVKIYNYGKNLRDFTYIDDVVIAIQALMAFPPEPDEVGARYKLYNIGNGNPISMRKFITVLEQALKEEKILDPAFSAEEHLEYVEGQPGDVEFTCADTAELTLKTGFHAKMGIEYGLQQFARWYAEYFKLNQISKL